MSQNGSAAFIELVNNKDCAHLTIILNIIYNKKPVNLNTGTRDGNTTSVESAPE